MSAEGVEVLRVLIEVRDALARIEERLAGPGRPQDLPRALRAGIAPGRGRYNVWPQRLLPHAQRIHALKKQGRPNTEILEILRSEGIQTSKSALSRFVRGYLMDESAESRER